MADATQTRARPETARPNGPSPSTADGPGRRPRVVVIGGGIAGLAAAHRLTRLAPAVAVTLVERDARLGGKVVTEEDDGFLVEGGPDSFLAAKPAGVGLCRELGIEADLRGPDPARRGAYVLWRGRLHRLPEGLTGLVPTRLGPVARSGLLSPAGKARLALDLVLPPRRGDDDESLAAFVERRLGRQTYERLVEPLMAGIYAGDGRALSLAATFPQLRDGERRHGGLIRGVLAARRAAPAPELGDPPAAPPRPAFLTPADGTGAIVRALADRLRAAGVEIRLGTTATGLRPLPGAEDPGYEVTLDGHPPLVADAVVVAIPAPVAATLLGEAAPEAAEALSSIPHVSSATLSLAYRAENIPRPLDAYGYVVPRAAGRDVLAGTWTSAKWTGRAPEGRALLRVFLGRAGREAILARSDDELIAVARHELREVLGITAPPLRTWLFRWPAGMPQYTLGHLDRIAAIEAAVAARPGLAIAGHALRGVGLPDCIRSGEAAAEAVAATLGAAIGTIARACP